eukprot:1157906-Pelagomonas_calceolata.AAC.6
MRAQDGCMNVPQSIVFGVDGKAGTSKIIILANLVPHMKRIHTSSISHMSRVYPEGVAGYSKTINERSAD